MCHPTLTNGNRLKADGQLAGTPSIVFDAVALVLSAEAGQCLTQEAAAVDWVCNAFGHLKAIAADMGAQAVLQAAGVEMDQGVVKVTDCNAFIEAAKTRQWSRETKVRKLP